VFRNYLTIAFRNLVKHKGDTTINLVGLCVAFTAALLLFLSVYYEFSFDRFHKNVDNIYTLYFKTNKADKVEMSSSMATPLLPALKAAYPDVEHGVRYINHNAVVRHGEKKIQKNVKFTDADFFSMFTFPMVKGGDKNALSEPNNAVITKSAALAIFGTDDATGKMVELQLQGEWKSFLVSAISEDLPDNSSIQYDIVVRFEQHPDYASNATRWDNSNHNVYVQLKDGIKPSDFEKKLAPFVNQNFAESIQNLKRDGAKPGKDGSYIQMQLQPLKEMHTTKAFPTEGSVVSKEYLYLLLIIGILIVAIACINFINLSIGRSFTRTREIGLRKTLGAQRWQLTSQFWGEAFLICLLSFIVSCFAFYLLVPSYKQLFAMNINREILFSPLVWLGIAAVFFFITLLAGGYPAWLMSRFNVVEVLKGKVSFKRSNRLRNSLIVVQFSIATLLIICTIVSWQQVDYLRSKPLGYNRTQIISIPVEGEIDPTRALELMREKLASYPTVESISGIYDNLGRGLDGSSRTSKVGFDYKNKGITSNWMGVSYDFVKTLDITLLDGREFSKDLPTDSNAVIINEAMAKQLGEKEAVGVQLPVDEDGPPMQVIGVVKDFHFKSLHQEIEPLTLVLSKDFPIHYILVKARSNALPQTMQLLKDTWKTILPTADFKGSFTDQNIDRQYRREEKLGQIFVSGGTIAIVLSCMGLLAMVILIVTQRTKEIGIRKVLGASITSIVSMLSTDFLKLVAVSVFIAFPIAWFAMSKWLENFAFRINIAWWVFAIAGILATVIALSTISIQTIRAALRNPVKSLRSE
jgi:ABC-type antimicrobial peptide transport system permease subunit